ncbi:MAG: glucose-1-phosphate thymidylyltransferase [Elusimicrobia bacterium]|nr:glucose-1-phosphate thymidylyltransferase [Elusimicrobiota bacterium]
MSKLNFKPENFFNIEDFPQKAIFNNIEKVWEVLPRIEKYLGVFIEPNVSDIIKNGALVKKTLILENGSFVYEGSCFMDDKIQIGTGVIVEPGALIYGPTIIGDNSVIRQGAYIRGKVIIGKNCVVGHSTEVKNSVLTGNSKAGHFAYIGDSILGEVNLGAGTKLANLKIVEGSVYVSAEGMKISTGLRKFGAILADGVLTGCNSVTSPGTIMGRNSILYPNTVARGYYPKNSVVRPALAGGGKERKE